MTAGVEGQRRKSHVGLAGAHVGGHLDRVRLQLGGPKAEHRHQAAAGEIDVRGNSDSIPVDTGADLAYTYRESNLRLVAPQGATYRSTHIPAVGTGAWTEQRRSGRMIKGNGTR